MASIFALASRGMFVIVSSLVGKAFFACLASFAVVNRSRPASRGMMELLYRDECYKIMGACFEVYKEMGCGFVEPVYQECLAIEFRMQKIQFAQQLELSLEYKQEALKQTYKPDFVCLEKIIVEIKAVSKLADEHRAQVHNYLKATGHKLGLLVILGTIQKWSGKG